MTFKGNLFLYDLQFHRVLVTSHILGELISPICSIIFVVLRLEKIVKARLDYECLCRVMMLKYIDRNL